MQQYSLLVPSGQRTMHRGLVPRIASHHTLRLFSYLVLIRLARFEHSTSGCARQRPIYMSCSSSRCSRSSASLTTDSRLCCARCSSLTGTQPSPPPPPTHALLPRALLCSRCWRRCWRCRGAGCSCARRCWRSRCLH